MYCTIDYSPLSYTVVNHACISVIQQVLPVQCAQASACLMYPWLSKLTLSSYALPVYRSLIGYALLQPMSLEHSMMSMDEYDRIEKQLL